MFVSIHPRLRPAVLIATGAAVAAGAFVIGPVAAQDAVTLASLITCSSSSPCASWQNKGSGPAIQATAVGDGVRGLTSGKGKAGVYGENDATSGGYGVHGANSLANGIGVYAAGGAGTGLLANTSGGIGVLAEAKNGTGLYANATSGVGLNAFSSTGTGIIADSSYGPAIAGSTESATSPGFEMDVYGNSSAMFDADGAHVYATAGNGAVIANGAYSQNGIDDVVGNDSVRFGEIVGGKSFGLIALTGAGTGGYPLEASSANSSGTVTGFFYVDGGGSVHYTGSLQSYARTRGGLNATAYEVKATRASVEDSGSAELVGGSAVVQLDPAFAQTIDLSSPYRVFLTPNGDTRGLFVSQKTPTSFVVRETQGGRGSFSFDYRILATAAGQSGARMAMVTPAVEARAFPMLAARGARRTFSGIAVPPPAPLPGH